MLMSKADFDLHLFKFNKNFTLSIFQIEDVDASFNKIFKLEANQWQKFSDEINVNENTARKGKENSIDLKKRPPVAVTGVKTKGNQSSTGFTALTVIYPLLTSYLFVQPLVPRASLQNLKNRG